MCAIDVETNRTNWINYFVWMMFSHQIHCINRKWVCMCVCVCISTKKDNNNNMEWPSLCGQKMFKFAWNNQSPSYPSSDGRNRIGRAMHWLKHRIFCITFERRKCGAISLSTVNNVVENVDSHPMVFQRCAATYVRFDCLFFSTASIININQSQSPLNQSAFNIIKWSFQFHISFLWYQ